MKLQDKITHQLDISDGGTTDATASLTRAGTPSGVISVATRYLHTLANYQRAFLREQKQPLCRLDHADIASGFRM